MHAQKCFPRNESMLAVTMRTENLSILNTAHFAPIHHLTVYFSSSIMSVPSAAEEFECNKYPCPMLGTIRFHIVKQIGFFR